ncbi:MAG: MerR family transcriptional regulator, partial [Nocardioidaceae bacterium]
TLMSDGASVYECTSNDEVIDLLQGGQGVFGIAIGGVWREIEGSLAELPSERAVEDGDTHAADELAARRKTRATG